MLSHRSLVRAATALFATGSAVTLTFATASAAVPQPTFGISTTFAQESRYSVGCGYRLTATWSGKTEADVDFYDVTATGATKLGAGAFDWAVHTVTIDWKPNASGQHRLFARLATLDTTGRVQVDSPVETANVDTGSCVTAPKQKTTPLPRTPGEPFEPGGNR